ncbi:DNA translocase FtsK [Bacillus sp. FJAT-47783]|uniref:DNA translocase FtsK n=1 Tax=Bacillus sp. FJAT-47783 TaxID=2922712 RepID=UPI002434F886|nr:DNA translocase FtsK [Bacillus sp. FJAT-47783]
MMSWLSKIVKWMIGDSEEPEQVQKQYFTDKQKMIDESITNQANKQQEVTARVTYRYPKGNFRFPIMFDDEQTYPRRKQKSVHSINDEHDRKEPKHVYRKPYQEPAKSRGRFRPTEIPSPIYGFGPRQDDLYIEDFLKGNKKQSQVEIEQQLNEPIDVQSFEKIESEETTNRMKEEFLFPHSEQNENQINKEENEINNYSFDETNENEATKSPEECIDNRLIDAHNSSQIHETSLVQEVAPNEIAASESPHNEQVFEFVNTNISMEENHDQQKSIQMKTHASPNELEAPLEKQSEEAISTPSTEVQRENGLHETKAENDDPEDNKQKENRTNATLVNKTETFTSNPDGRNKEHKQSHKDRKNEQHKGNRDQAVPYNVLMFGRDKRKLARQEHKGYTFPSLSLLTMPPAEKTEDSNWVNEQAELLNRTLTNFNVRAHVVNVTQGPSVTRLEVQPEPGVKVSKITNLTDDIKLSLSARDIRIEAPIPGKNTIGIEVPNPKSKMVYLREILRSPQFTKSTSRLTVALGLDISGNPIVTDLKKMPHGLIAGATGSGKSVCINTILISLLYKATPQEVKLLLIDPKMVELAPYNHIPHLVSPVITDVKAATASLKWAVEEMERRYELFAHTGVRDINRFNEQVKKHHQGEKLPYIVIIIDELADLMMVAPGDVEEAICRIAQKARACGIHLLIATQRPSVDVITGLIKANIPTRIAFSVSSQVDSRTIIDTAGAERLLGKGDMLFLENGSSKAVRLQGNFVADDEIERVVEHTRKQGKPQYSFSEQDLLKKVDHFSEEDELYNEACEFVIEQGGASTSSLQRRFRIGYNRAARLIDLMEQQGIISESKGSKPRDVLVTEEEFSIIKESSVE